MPPQTTLTGSSKPRGKLADADAPIDGPIDNLGTLKTFSRSAEIYGQNEPADRIYKVISGAVRTCRVLVNGRRQIGAFCLPGDLFGLEVRDEHTFSAEAVTELRVVVAKRSALIVLAENDSGSADQLWSLIGQELFRVQEQALLLGMTAPERIATFLLEMADRLPCGDCLELPMPRQDIADYLGLTIETVSRTFTGLERGLAIQMPTSRRIIIRNHASLDRLAHGRR